MNGAGSGPDGPLVALTGATGFLGSHIADALLARGWRVRASLRPTSDRRWLHGKPVEMMTVDLGSRDDLQRFVAGARWVVHCAGIMAARDEATFRRVNVATTRGLLEAAAAAGTLEAFVLISSLAAAGPAPIDDPRDESRPCRPISAYGRSKLAAEAELDAVAWPFRTVALRPPALYGPRDREFLPLLRAARRGWTARIGRVLTGLSLVHGADAAAAVLALLEAPQAKGAYFVDDGPAAAAGPSATRRHACGYDFDELRDALAAAAGRRVRRVVLPLGVLRFAAGLSGKRRAARSPVWNTDRLVDLGAPGWVCCGRRLQRETNFRPRFDLVTGLCDTFAAGRTLGWLR